MGWKRAQALVLCLLFCFAPAIAFGVDRKTVKLRFAEFPVVNASDLDYSSIEVEVGFGETVFGEPVIKTTSSTCVPEQSDNKFKDAVQLTTYYYEVPFRTEDGFVVVRDATGDVLHTARIEGLDSYERFGFNRCEYWWKDNLIEDLGKVMPLVTPKAATSARGYFERNAQEVLDDSLFVNVVGERVPVYTFKDKHRNYDDLNEATRLARDAYAELRETIAGIGQEGLPELEQAVELWKAALEETDFADKNARINRKVTARIHESIGLALIALGEPSEAVRHFKKAIRLNTMVTSRTNGTGTADLLERAQKRKSREAFNTDLRSNPEAVRALIARAKQYRGLIPVDVVPTRDLARLEAEHNAHSVAEMLQAAEEETTEREVAIASGAENPYERMVGQTATQGFFLFLMPYPKKLPDFPSEVCSLTHLNRLRIPNHVFVQVPDEIGNLSALEVLDLSGNRLETLPSSIGALANLKKLNLTGNQIESLPDEIGQLENLKLLQLKDNPLAPGEVDRLKQLLPRCKIKV